MDTQRLQIEQLDHKLADFQSLARLTAPPQGWVRFIRQSIGMSLRQLGVRLGMTPQAVRDLEMREADSSARIVFVTSHGRKMIAEDAAYSSGAVGVLVTPITDAQVGGAWSDWHGTIPEAPGLSDLDALYPVLEDPEPEPPAFPMMPGLPPLPDTTPNNPTNVELPSTSTASVADFKPQKKRSKVRWLVRLTVLFLLTGGSLGAAHYLGLVDLNGLIEEFRSTISSLIN